MQGVRGQRLRDGYHTGLKAGPVSYMRGSYLAGTHTGNAPPRKFASDRVSKPVSLRLDRGLSNLRTPP